MIELIERKRNVAEVNTLSPLTWAYVGDSVFELLVRTHLTNTTKLKPHMLHIEAIKYVKADAQVKLLHKIEKELNDDEKNIVRRGRNAENHHVPKNATVEEYSYATAFEALIGYLYLTKQTQRLQEILTFPFTSFPIHNKKFKRNFFDTFLMYKNYLNKN